MGIPTCYWCNYHPWSSLWTNIVTEPFNLATLKPNRQYWKGVWTGSLVVICPTCWLNDSARKMKTKPANKRKIKATPNNSLSSPPVQEVSLYGNTGIRNTQGTANRCLWETGTLGMEQHCEMQQHFHFSVRLSPKYSQDCKRMGTVMAQQPAVMDGQLLCPPSQYLSYHCLKYKPLK